MKKCFLAIAIMLSIAACTGQGEEAGAAAPAPDAMPAGQANAQPAPPPPAVPGPGESVVVGGAGSAVSFPEGISLAFPYVVRSQRNATSRSGKPRYWVGLEYQDGSPTEISSTIERSMVEAGFSPVAAATEEDGDGTIRRKFEKKGFGVVSVAIHGPQGQKLVDPASKGVAWLDFPAN